VIKPGSRIAFRLAGQPLLFVGADFAATDLDAA